MTSWGWNFCKGLNIGNLEHLISIFNVGTGRLEDPCSDFQSLTCVIIESDLITSTKVFFDTIENNVKITFLFLK